MYFFQVKKRNLEFEDVKVNINIFPHYFLYSLNHVASDWIFSYYPYVWEICFKHFIEHIETSLGHMQFKDHILFYY